MHLAMDNETVVTKLYQGERESVICGGKILEILWHIGISLLKEFIYLFIYFLIYLFQVEKMSKPFLSASSGS